MSLTKKKKLPASCGLTGGHDAQSTEVDAYAHAPDAHLAPTLALRGLAELVGGPLPPGVCCRTPEAPCSGMPSTNNDHLTMDWTKSRVVGPFWS